MLGQGRLLLLESDAAPGAAIRIPLAPDSVHIQLVIPPRLLGEMYLSVGKERPVLDVPKAGRS